MGLLLRTVNVSSCAGCRRAQSALNASHWKKKKKSKLLSLSHSLIRPLALWMSRREAFLSSAQRYAKSERILNKHDIIDGAAAHTSVPQFSVQTRLISLMTIAYICNNKHFMYCFRGFFLNLQNNVTLANPLDLLILFYKLSLCCFVFLSSENVILSVLSFFIFNGRRLQHPHIAFFCGF